MQPAIAKQLADSLLRQYPILRKWTVEFSSRAVRTLGLCVYTRRVIQLSHAFVQLNEQPKVIEVVRHEIAHALVGPGYGHGPVWKRMALLVGAPPLRCIYGAALPVGRYVAVCPCCKRVFRRHRRPRLHQPRCCAACGSERGLLRFTTAELEFLR